MPRSFRERLSDQRPVLLDGATGTELSRRGIAIDGPLWSAAAIVHHPQILRQVHADYSAAGAEVITANTFRTHRRNLRAGGCDGHPQELTQLAVELARSAGSGEFWIAGSQAPLEDCYRPELVPGNRELDNEHAAMAESLAASGVDLILCETHNCVREVRAAAQAAWRTGLPIVVSVVCGSDGRLLSGETLTQAAEEVLCFDPLAVLVNCLPAAAVPAAVRELQTVCGKVPVGAYANAGACDPRAGWMGTQYSEPAIYAAAAAHWLREGARVIGGCCGTTPAHISALRQLISDRNPQVSR